MSVKTNYIYTVTLNLSQIIFPLITFPYVTRVLGPSGLGITNFATSFTNYFIILATFGINIYGQREVAKHRNNKADLSRVFNQMLFIHLSATLFFFLIYLGIVLGFSKFRAEPILYALSGAFLWLNIFSIEWFYLGIEKFSFITIRTVITRIVFVIAIFLLVKSKSDYILYYALIIISTCIPFIVNMVYAKRFITISLTAFYNLQEIWRHFKNLIYSSLYMSITSIYAGFSIIYLGFVSTNENVGYFAVANKLYTVVLSFFTALTVVLYPRLSSLIAQKDEKEFKRLIDKSFDVFLPVSVTIAIISILVSKHVIHLFAGNKFEKSILILQIYMPLVVVVGTAQIYVSQILFPLQKDKQILINLIIVASISVLLNMVLVTKFTLMGAIIALVISETLMTTLLGILVYRYQKIAFPIGLFSKNILMAIPYFLFFWLAKLCFSADFLILTGMSVLSFIYFIVIQCFVARNKSIIAIVYQGLYKLKFRNDNRIMNFLYQNVD
jgi:O-antigen/teichoic acid export membrane protein